MVTCKLVGGVGHQCALVGRVVEDQFKKVGVWVPFNIKLGGYHFAEQRDVIIPDMPLVRSWVYGDAFSSERFTVGGYLNEIGDITSPRISE